MRSPLFHQEGDIVKFTDIRDEFKYFKDFLVKSFVTFQPLNAIIFKVDNDIVYTFHNNDERKTKSICQ